MTCRGPGVRVVAGVFVLALAAASGLRASAPRPGLTAPQGVARVLDLIYDADFAAAEVELSRVCGPAPREACEVLRPVMLWWRLFLDLEDRSRDRAFLDGAEAAIATAERWTTREPDRAEAWFYLGAALGTRLQYRSYRKEYLAGARDGKRVRQALQRALQIDPSLHDANVGIGLYKYYADIAPTVLKLLRWLLALPGGNRVEGLRQIEQTRNAGVLLRSEAAYQLYLIDIWYENQIDRARSYLDEVRARHPRNPLFLLNLAQLHDIYRSDRPAALEAYQALVDGAAAGTLREAALAEVWGRRGVAVQLDALAETDRAIEHLRVVVDRRPTAPFGSLAGAYVDLGTFQDRMGRRDQAVAAYRAALGTAPAGDPENVRGRASAGITRAPDRVGAEAYRLSLEGWRLFERGQADAAASAIDRSLRARPDDGVARYRRGRVWLASGDRERARVEFERALAVRPRPPAPFVAMSHLELGHLYAASGDRARAVAAYEWATRVPGGGAAVAADAQRARAALGR